MDDIQKRYITAVEVRDKLKLRRHELDTLCREFDIIPKRKPHVVLFKVEDLPKLERAKLTKRKVKVIQNEVRKKEKELIQFRAKTNLSYMKKINALCDEKREFLKDVRQDLSRLREQANREINQLMKL